MSTTTKKYTHEIRCHRRKRLNVAGDAHEERTFNARARGQNNVLRTDDPRATIAREEIAAVQANITIVL